MVEKTDSAEVEVLALEGRLRPLTYQVPPALREKVAVGSLVKIPILKRVVPGIVRRMGGDKTIPRARLRMIHCLEHPFPVLTEKLLELAQWMARYYMAPLGNVFETMIPAPVRKGAREAEQRFVKIEKQLSAEELEKLKKRSPKQAQCYEFLKEQANELPRALVLSRLKLSASTLDALVEKGIVAQFSKTRHRHAYDDDLAHAEKVDPKPFELNEEQRAAFDDICNSIDAQKFRAHLLHGVTGSGKTEVYLQAIRHTLKAGRDVVYLVPEVALTPQTVGRLRARLADLDTGIVVWHSQLSDGERFDAWKALATGQARVVVGARSAVFAPLKNVGLVIVDEEHEPAYKQEEAPRYHGRDTAVYRAMLEKAVCVLGSATPSFESMLNAKRGRYKLNTLLKRVDDRKLPLVELVDMRHEGFKAKGGVLSRTLADKIHDRLENREQTILFLNRRGYFSTLLCPDCGYVGMCPHCSIPMTFHRTDERVRCHLCGYTNRAPQHCPQCKSEKIRWKGFGTQRIEETVQNLFPRARVVRLDADAMSKKNLFRKILGDFRQGKIDILIGTQMIAKGLDFPKVTLVGMISADISLHLSDFRAPERTFQLLVQVAGRAGRGDRTGEVVVQTYTPFEPPIQFAKRAEYAEFYEAEMQNRRELAYPPFRHVIRHVFKGRNPEKTAFFAEQWARRVEEAFGQSVELRGPAPAPLEKAKDFYRFHLWTFCDTVMPVAEKMAKLREDFPNDPDVQDTFDVDPIDVL